MGDVHMFQKLDTMLLWTDYFIIFVVQVVVKKN